MVGLMARVILPPVPTAARLPNHVQQGTAAGQPAVAFGAVNQRRLAPVIQLQPGPPLAREKTQDRQANEVQTKTLHAVQQAKSNPKANGNLLENVKLLSLQANRVEHGLGVPFRGVELSGFSTMATWYVIRPGVNASLDATQIELEVSADVTVDIYVWG